MGKRYYAKNGSLFANSDYNPQEVIVNDFSELVKITDRLEPGAIGRVVGRKQSYELNTDRVWISETGVPFITDEESEELDGGYVQFIDYDGTMIAKVKGEDVANMMKLPANPEHKGLVSQGWNWELDRIKYYMAKYPEAVMTVGQMYCTADGATHIHMNVQGRLTVPLCFQQSVENGVTLDWGDGTKETVAGTGVVTTEHAYAAEGKYILRMKAAEGCEMNFGDGEGHNIFGETNNISGQFSGKYSYYISSVEFGNDIVSIAARGFGACCCMESIAFSKNCIDISEYSFYYCYALKAIIIPIDITEIKTSVFNNCLSVKYISLPEKIIYINSNAFNNNYAKFISLFFGENLKNIFSKSFTYSIKLRAITFAGNSLLTITNNAFNACYNLKKIILPDSVTTIGNSTFMGCRALSYVSTSKNLQSIDAYAFSNCYNLQTFILKAEIPPTILFENAFSNIANDCIFYVPYSEDHSILEAYKTATNWSVYAEQMVEMEPEEEPDEPEETPTEP